ncbi:MAG TPA: hypothetical protein ENK66_02610 [Arcobacter sp.]|nr:hypothetical protein [Arcobacter sp.]
MSHQDAAITFTIVAMIIATFQFSLAQGAPFGDMVLGGNKSKVLPKNLRILALLQGVLILFLAFVLLVNTNIVHIMFLANSNFLVWLSFFISALSFLGNILSQSLKERLFGVPMAGILFFTSGVITLY